MDIEKNGTRVSIMDILPQKTLIITKSYQKGG